MHNWSERLRRLICWLMILLVGLVPFVFCWLSDELFEFNKMQFVYLLTTVITCLYLTRMVIEKRLIWRHSLLNYPLGFFLLSQVIATLLSMHQRTSWLGYYTRLNGGLLSTLTYIALYCAYLNNFSARERRYLLNTLVVSSAIVSLYAIGEHFGHSFSCFIIKGNFDVSCWVQDVQTRVYATLGQPNWLAAYNVSIIGLISILILSAWQPKKSKFLEIMMPVSLVLNFCSLIFTKSRSGIIAFGAGLLMSIILLILAWRGQTRNFVWKQCRLLMAILLLLLVPALIWGTQYTSPASAWFHSAYAQTLEMGLPEHLKNIDTGITDSADIRKIVWRGALDIWRHYPLFGTGVETFAYSYYRFRPSDHNWTSEWDFLYNKAHNELLNFASNSGTFGLVAYLSIFVVLAFSGVRYIITSKNQTDYIDKSYWYIGIICSLIALSITNFFGFSTVSVQVILYVFLAIAADLEAPASVEAAIGPVNETWQSITFVTLGIACLSLLGQVWRTWYADFNYARCKSQITRNASEAIERCAHAISLRPQEALYKIDLGNFFVQYAYALLGQDATYTEQARSLIQAGLEMSNQGLALNPNNLNFYKTRYLMFTVLAKIDPQAWELAKNDLEEAQQRSPTDPKLAYYYGLVMAALDKNDRARQSFERAVALRPLYLDARIAAALAAEEAGDLSAARTHYLYLDQFLEQSARVKAGLDRTSTASGNISEKIPENQ